jgi:hypothetical protein
MNLDHCVLNIMGRIAKLLYCHCINLKDERLLYRSICIRSFRRQVVLYQQESLLKVGDLLCCFRLFIVPVGKTGRGMFCQKKGVQM